MNPDDAILIPALPDPMEHFPDETQRFYQREQRVARVMQDAAVPNPTGITPATDTGLLGKIGQE